MLIPSELRIGNILQRDPIIWNDGNPEDKGLDTIFIDEEIIKSISSRKEHSYYPAPVSSFIWHFNFNRVFISKELALWTIMDDAKFVVFQSSNLFYVETDIVNHKKKYFNYMHQLQNYFFDITRKELKWVGLNS